MTPLAQAGIPTPQAPIDLLKYIPVLEDAAPPAAPENGGISPWLLWGLIAAGLLIAGALTWYTLRKRRAKATPPTPEEVAQGRLEALAARQTDLRTCSLELSLILREYLADKTQDTALYETHEEFSRRLDSLSAIPQECQYGTRMLLEKFAEIKYSDRHRDSSPQQVAALIRETADTILSIQEAQQKAAEMAKELEKIKKLS